jgi:lysozyme family protein
MTDDAIISEVLAREGGYVDHPADRGGPTNFGITLATLADFVGHPVTASDVRLLDETTARTIYRSRYIWLVRLALVLLSPLCLCIWIYCRIKFGAGYEPPAPRIMR